MTTHSPGPWSAESAMSSDLHHVRYITADGKIIASVRHRIEHSMDEAIANAKLMASAPALLTLLVESQTSIGGDWRQRRDATIAKVTGDSKSAAQPSEDPANLGLIKQMQQALKDAAHLGLTFERGRATILRSYIDEQEALLKRITEINTRIAAVELGAQPP